MLLLGLLFLGFSNLNAQSLVVNGYLTDSTSGEKLQGAYVFEASKAGGTSTNEYGFYSVSFNKDTVHLIVSYVGYQPIRRIIIGRKVHTLNFQLIPSVYLRTVEIAAQKNAAPIQEQTQMSSVSIPIEQIKKVPALFGEVDVLKVLQLLPGVSKGSEGSSGIFVRGGGADQNLILLDGVPVYNVNHLFGFFSVFNGDAISNVNLIKGGFPARYGGRLSSVIDINMKEGNNKKLHGEVGLGIISSRFTVEGPIKNEKTTFLIAGRRTYVDVFLRPITKAISKGAFSTGYYFYDLNAKVNHKFSDKDRVYLSAYLGKDVFSAKVTDESTNNNVVSSVTIKPALNWGNLTTSFRWNHLLSPKLFMNTTATYTQFNFRAGASFQLDQTDLVNSANNTSLSASNYKTSGIRDVGAKSDFDFSPNNNHHVKWGYNYIYHTFTPGIEDIQQSGTGLTAIDSSFGSSKIFANEGFVYLEDDWEISDRWKVNVGLHASGFLVRDTFYKSLQPRLSVRYLLNEKWSIKASAAKMTQYLHLLTNSGIGLPTDLWLPVTNKIVPQQSWQYALGTAYLYNKDFEVSVEGYYKAMDHVIEYKNGANFLSNNEDWESKVTAGKGWSYGGEVLIQKKYGKTTGWIGYTLAWAYRQFDEKNNGKKYFYKYDQRHNIGVVVSHQWKPNLDVSGTWVYNTGNALTLASEKYAALNNSTSFLNTIENAPQLNSFRAPSYHRMDLGINYHKKKKWGEVVYNFSIYNVYNRLNAFFIIQSGNELKKVSIFPILPSISINLKF
jgi:hypothetical protein